VKNKEAEPGGWVFEFRMIFYPTSTTRHFVLMALQRVEISGRQAHGSGGAAPGIQWLLSMQNRDGGWGAFDRDNTKRFCATFRLRITTR